MRNIVLQKCNTIIQHKIYNVENIGLSEKALTAIKDNTELFGKVAQVLGIAPVSLPRLIYSNHTKLTQAAVLKILRDSLNCEDSELLTEMQTA